MQKAMASSQAAFKRWVCREESTWPFQMFTQYSLEQGKQVQAHKAASRRVYRTLGADGAQWPDKIDAHFQFDPAKKAAIFQDLKDWSDTYNAFDNWVNLNSVLFSSSNLETYLATVIRLALESDPGLTLGKSRLIDGTVLLKYPSASPRDLEPFIVQCTKGDWQSRLSGIKGLFGVVPQEIAQNIADLERIRRLRNSVAHAIGRDIEDSRVHGVKQILPIERISQRRTNLYHTRIQSVAKAVDRQLLANNIGEFQIVHFYHSIYPGLRADVHPNQRAVYLKTEVGRFGALSPSKEFCKELVDYYEAI